jgi:hypothetical protein
MILIITVLLELNIVKAATATKTEELVVKFP